MALFPRILTFSVLAACAGAAPNPDVPHAADPPPVEWHEWEASAFEQAEREGKHLLVSVQAAWCHWCHVMNDETFGDAEVRARLAADYIAIKVDSDARPDLAERFQDYAWPATILLSPQAEVVLPLRGFRPPRVRRPGARRRRAGREVHDTDTPVARPIDDLDTVRSEATALLDRLYDEDAGGWGARQKYPYAGPLEHAIFRAAVLGEGETWNPRVEHTLAGHAALIDPVFGGVFQYSLPGTGDDRARGTEAWTRPHFEKITGVQADALQTFAQACLSDERWCASAEDVRRYVARFLTADAGGFYTSQDADLDHQTTGTTYYAWDEVQRLEHGVPRVDQNVYADLNGRLIVALAALDAARPDSEARAMAVAAGEFVESRLRPEGADLFEHGGTGTGLQHLGDTAWMLRAELALYEATSDPVWLERAQRSARGLRSLVSPSGALFAHTEDPAAAGVFAERRTPLTLNGVAARALIHLHRLDHDEAHLELALGALRAVADATELRRRGRRIGEYLMALEALRPPSAVPYTHLTLPTHAPS